MTIEKTVSVRPEVDSGKIITFSQDIPDFEKYTRFTIFHKEENGINIYWLESVDSPTVTSTVVDSTSDSFNYELWPADQEKRVCVV